jgi:predicted HTH domain antitoxin
LSQVTLTLPDGITEADARLYLAMKLFELGRLSCGKAAEVAGYSKRTFIEILGKHGISIFNYPPEELASDLVNARRADRHQH